jgi:hypothetical protein
VGDRKAFGRKKAQQRRNTRIRLVILYLRHLWKDWREFAAKEEKEIARRI